MNLGWFVTVTVSIKLHERDNFIASEVYNFKVDKLTDLRTLLDAVQKMERQS